MNLATQRNRQLLLFLINAKQVTLISCYLSVEVVVQVPLLVLRAQHVHDFAVLRGAGRALGLALSVAFKAVLVERMAAEEMNGRQLQGAVAHVALCLLEYLGTVWTD